MQYHAQSLASKPGSVVHIVAYDGAKPLSSLTSASNVHIHPLPEVPQKILRLPGLLRLALKVLHQLVAMLWLLLVVLPVPSNILMQNPPCIPTMVLCW
jgi:beta-1,4-mannosyltransferase